jgi:hypothetical protein
MNNVKQLRPLLSIPHMLRFWADMFDNGDEEMPKSILLVCVPTDASSVPALFGAGQDMNRCEEIGALFTATRIASETELS